MRNDKIAYTVEEAADISGIGRNTIRQLVDWEKLPVALKNLMRKPRPCTRGPRLPERPPVLSTGS